MDTNDTNDTNSGNVDTEEKTSRESLERLRRRMHTLRSHHNKCETASTPVKTPEKDPPDSTISSPHEFTSDMSDDDYAPPSSSSSCASVCSSLSCESPSEPTQSHSQPAETYSKNHLLIRNTEIQEVKVKCSKKKSGKRVWDKAHYCVYCKKSNLKMARHLQMKHIDEKDVAHAFSFPPGSRQRKNLLESLRNKGDWLHNQKVLQEGKGQIVTWKQPSADSSVSDYLPCHHCFAMFKKRDLWRHDKTCRDKKDYSDMGLKRKRIQAISSKLLPFQKTSEGVQNIINNMLQDNITAEVRSDEMICNFGDSLYARKGREQSQHRYISQKLRELGRFLLAAKKIDKKIKGLKDLCDPTKFNLAIEAARKVSHFNADKSEYGKPSTAVKIGFSLKAATDAWIGHCIMVSDGSAEQKSKKFKELLDKMWSDYVSANAHSSMEQKKWNKDDSVPLTKDIVALQNHLRTIEEEAIAELKQTVTVSAYKRLCESLLAQVIVFNKKREGEASRITLDMFQKADTGKMNTDIYETLSPVEKMLSHRLSRMVTRGKRGRRVPVLFLERTKTSIDFMIKLRDKVGVREDNPFLFANIGTTTNIRGCDCLRKFSMECKAENPELLRSTKLRKHVATLCQLLDLSDQELEQVAKFMGHDIRVHCNYYRQTDKTFQVAKIGKLLFAMEGGAVALKGNTLQTLDSAVCDQTWTQSRSDEEHHSMSEQSDGEDHTEQQTILEQPSTDQPGGSSVDKGIGESEAEGEESLKQSMTLPKKKIKRINKFTEESDSSGEDVLTLHSKKGNKPPKKRPANKSTDDAQVKTKRPWSKVEKGAVLRRMGKFIALKKIPGKEACMLTKTQESPALKHRTWKDVKYFVYNEIQKVKKKIF